VTRRQDVPEGVALEEMIMKRTLALILAALAAAALVAGLVHAVLVVAHVSEPATTTVYGLTFRRIWATSVAMLALSWERGSFLVAALLAASGLVGLVYGLVATGFLAAATFPGPLFGSSSGFPCSVSAWCLP
jgi:peptidoglycan/LPS O-acetylase OafA/YrhL